MIGECCSNHKLQSLVQGNASDMTKYQVEVSAMENVNFLRNKTNKDGGIAVDQSPSPG